MKYPRWLIVMLLGASILAMLGAGAWWWVTWPERLASEFVTRLSEQNFHDAWAVISKDELPPNLEILMHGDNEDESHWKLHARPRSLADIVSGRQSFWTGNNGDIWVVERGSFRMAQPYVR